MIKKTFQDLSVPLGHYPEFHYKEGRKKNKYYTSSQEIWALVPVFINSIHRREPQFPCLRVERWTLLMIPKPVLVSDDIFLFFAAKKGGKEREGERKRN